MHLEMRIVHLQILWATVIYEILCCNDLKTIECRVWKGVPIRYGQTQIKTCSWAIRVQQAAGVSMRVPVREI